MHVVCVCVCVCVCVSHSLSLSLSLCLSQDTAGSERYESMSRIYYRGAKAAIVCFGESPLVDSRLRDSH